MFSHCTFDCFTPSVVKLRLRKLRHSSSPVRLSYSSVVPRFQTPEALPTQPSSSRSRIREQHSRPAAKPCHNKDEENKTAGKGKETIQTKERQPCCKQGQGLVRRGPGPCLNQNNLKVWVFILFIERKSQASLQFRMTDGGLCLASCSLDIPLSILVKINLQVVLIYTQLIKFNSIPFYLGSTFDNCRCHKAAL